MKRNRCYDEKKIMWTIFVHQNCCEFVDKNHLNQNDPFFGVQRYNTIPLFWRKKRIWTNLIIGIPKLWFFFKNSFEHPNMDHFGSFYSFKLKLPNHNIDTLLAKWPDYQHKRCFARNGSRDFMGRVLRTFRRYPTHPLVRRCILEVDGSLRYLS